jgi:glycosyltransferase involved in cell wall biosynthesis
MKIIFIIDHLRADGTQKCLLQITSGLVPRGHEITIVCLNDSWDAGLVRRLKEIPVEVRIIGKSAFLTGIGFFRLWSWLRRGKYDVAVTMLFVSDAFGRFFAKASGVSRVISSLRARNVNYTRLQRWLVRSTMRYVDCVVINSSNIREFAIQNEGAAPEKIRMIPNGIDVEQFDTPLDRCGLRRQFGLGQASVLLVTTGRLTPQKGIDILLRALALLEDNNLQLVIMGVGEAEASLRALVKKLRLEQRVVFAGYRHDIPEILGAFDLYIHPARFEGMPNALLEAMAAALPIVATNVDGNRQLIDDGSHGWLVPPKDPDVLATAIRLALNDRDEARRRGFAARQRVADKFSSKSLIIAWEEAIVYKEAAT